LIHSQLDPRLSLYGNVVTYSVHSRVAYDTLSLHYDLLIYLWASLSVGEALSSYLLTVSTSTPMRPNNEGRISDPVPPAQSTTTLSSASATPEVSTARNRS